MSIKREHLDAIMVNDSIPIKEKLRQASMWRRSKLIKRYPRIFGTVDGIIRETNPSRDSKHYLYVQFEQVKEQLKGDNHYLYYFILEFLDGYSEVVPDYFK